MSEHPSAGVDTGPKAEVPLGFGGLHARVGDHIGHFFQTDAECREVLFPFLKAGLEAGDKCVVLIGSTGALAEIRQSLAAGGVEVESAVASGQLLFDHGRSSPSEMRKQLHAALADIPSRFPLLRWAADMTWALAKMPTSAALMEWETHCNVVEDPRALFLCQYHLASFDGLVMMDALKTHPTSIVGTAVHLNPYYQEPESFLDELKRRPERAAW